MRVLFLTLLTLLVVSCGSEGASGIHLQVCAQSDEDRYRGVGRLTDTGKAWFDSRQDQRYKIYVTKEESCDDGDGDYRDCVVNVASFHRYEAAKTACSEGAY